MSSAPFVAPSPKTGTCSGTVRKRPAPKTTRGAEPRSRPAAAGDRSRAPSAPMSRVRPVDAQTFRRTRFSASRCPWRNTGHASNRAVPAACLRLRRETHAHPPWPLRGKQPELDRATPMAPLRWPTSHEAAAAITWIRLPSTGPKARPRPTLRGSAGSPTVRIRPGRRKPPIEPLKARLSPRKDNRAVSFALRLPHLQRIRARQSSPAVKDPATAKNGLAQFPVHNFAKPA